MSTPEQLIYVQAFPADCSPSWARCTHQSRKRRRRSNRRAASDSRTRPAVRRSSPGSSLYQPPGLTVLQIKCHNAKYYLS